MILRSLAWFFLGLIGLLLLLQLLILLPPVQNKLKDVAVTAIEDNLDVEAAVGYFRMGFPKKFKVGDILIQGKNADTLISVGELSVNVAILPLMKKRIIVQNLYLDNVKGDIGKVLALLSPQAEGQEQPEPEPLPSPATAEESKPWTFGIRHLELVSIDLEFRDEEAGFDLGMKVGQIQIGLGDIDLDSLIHVKSVSITRTDVSFKMLETPPSVEEPDTGAFSFANITVGTLLLDEVGFTLLDSVSGMLLYTHAGSLSASDNFVDITHATIGVDEVELEDSWCDLVFLPDTLGEAEPVEVADTIPQSDGLDWGQALWRITGNKLAMENCRYTMEYRGEIELQGHFDPLHMHILEASGEISDFTLDEDTLVARITNLQAKDPGGFEILSFDADIAQDSMFTIRDMKIETPNTSLAIELQTTANPTNYSGLDRETFDLNLEIRGMNWSDADYFYPFIEEQALLTKSFGDSDFELSTSITGSLPELELSRLTFSMFDSTVVDIRGKILQGMDPDAMKMDITIAEVMTTGMEVSRNFNLGLPDSVFRLPEWMKLTGTYSGDAETHHFTGEMNSSNGQVIIPEAFAKLGDQLQYRVQLQAGLHHLDELADLEFDQAAFHLESSVAGSDLATLAGDLELIIDSLTYRSFLYRDLQLRGEIAGGQFKAAFRSGMPECLISLDADGRVQEDDLVVNLSADVENLDLYTLHFNGQDFTIAGNAEISLGIHPDDAYDLTLNLHQLDLDYKDSLYRLHPVDLSFTTGESITEFNLKSYFYQLTFNADDHILDVADAFIHLPGYYLSDKNSDSVQFSMPGFQVSGSLEYPREFATLFYPDLPVFEALTISGNYKKANDQLTLDLFLPVLASGGIQSDSLHLSVAGSSDELDLKVSSGLTVDDLLTGNVMIDGAFKNSELIANLIYQDSFSEDYLNITVQVDTLDENILVHLVPPDLVFSYDRWQVDPDNLVTINPDYIALENLELANGRQKIEIVSFPKEDPGTLELRLTDFALGSLEHLFAMDTVVAGVANAEVRVIDPLGQLAVDGTLTIDNLLLYDFEAGRLNVSQFTLGSDTASINLSLVGNKQDIALLGQWVSSDSLNPLQADLRINALQLSELNYLLDDYISDAKGQLEGDIRLTGDLSDPLVSGILKFTDAGMGIDMLNNYFTLGTESISVDNNAFSFDNFSIRNKQGQAATIIGSINLGDINNAYTNLLIKTDNMEIMNSSRKQNDVLFGLLKAHANIEVKGYVKNIRLKADVTIDKSTDVTYIFPDNLALDNNDGIVRYDKFEPEMIADEDVAKSSAFFSMESFRNVRSTVEIQSGARFNLFFDNSGSNFLDAALNGTINYSQVEDNSEVSGMFEVEEGTLNYGIPLVAVDEYEIEPGSSITLSNDLYNPYLNIVASSSVRASTEGLMSSDPKVMTFKILLYMQGELNDVKLRFDISQETGDALVSARLSQLTDQERNMNALNLLVRGSFMMSLHGDEVGGTTTMDAQIDKFYATHLNHLISENVSFVDLKFDVQSFKEYNAYGETVMQRNYYYNVGKSFFKDRARINYKGSLGVTSQAEAEQSNSHFVQNELEMELKITKNGVLRGVFFLKNQYEGLLEGEVIETGAGVRLMKDFYSIGDIFTSDKRLEKKQSENSNEQKTNEK